jgi:hypothetical protein
LEIIEELYKYMYLHIARMAAGKPAKPSNITAIYPKYTHNNSNSHIHPQHNTTSPQPQSLHPKTPRSPHPRITISLSLPDLPRNNLRRRIISPLPGGPIRHAPQSPQARNHLLHRNGCGESRSPRRSRVEIWQLGCGPVVHMWDGRERWIRE